jgi:hypothetical protein
MHYYINTRKYALLRVQFMALLQDHLSTSASPLTPAHAAAGIEWLYSMTDPDKWNLSAEEAADLLGGIPIRTYHDLKRKALNNEPINLMRDTLERISLLLGISKALQIIAPEGRKDLAYAWFNQPNAALGNESIKTFLMKRKTIEALYGVRRYLDNARG